MNLIEAALQANTRKQWFRPISWKWSGQALSPQKDGRIFFVPTVTGGHSALFPSLDDIIDDWEVVSPDDVLRERRPPPTEDERL